MVTDQADQTADDLGQGSGAVDFDGSGPAQQRFD
jgi:hypothetical protein